MNIDTIARGVFINFILSLIIAFFLVHYKFEISENVFTLLLLLSLFGVSVYAGATSSTNGRFNGTLIGAISAAALIIFLAQFSSMLWEVNGIILFIWISVGFVGGWVGTIIFNRRKEKEVL